MVALLEAYPLRMRENLQDAGDEPEWVYFPETGIISVLTAMTDGTMIEFAIIGREGSTGVPLFVGLGESNITLVSQMPGHAMRMRAPDFLRELERSPALAEAIKRFSGVMFATLAQSAACNRAHHVDERCARWILLTHDQAGGNEFPITGEFLSEMLGVDREHVSVAAAVLQAGGLITYKRGEMTVTDRGGLERASCECYGVIAREIDRMRELRQY